MTAEIFFIRSEDPNSVDAQLLLDEMTAMISVFGPSAKRPFASFTLPGRSVLLLVRGSTGVSFGCGAFVPESHYVAEIIGPYCRSEREDVNDAVLRRLERSAAQFGFIAVSAKVSAQNRRMLAFYAARGFQPTTSDQQSGSVSACCLQKRRGLEAGCPGSFSP